MATPENPLRNILFTGIFYRAMLQNVTGISYSAGNDLVNGKPYHEGDYVGGYIGSGQFVDRLQKLGATQANINSLKQIMVSFGFNAGIKSSKILLDNYIKQKEAKSQSVTDQDFNFPQINTGQWAIVTNLVTYVARAQLSGAKRNNGCLQRFWRS